MATRKAERPTVPRKTAQRSAPSSVTARPQRAMKTGEAVAETLRGQIVRGELRVGDRLQSEEELTVHFGVARTTLREALRILESQQLIEIRRGRGGGPVVRMPETEPLATGMAVMLQMLSTTIGDLDVARSMIEPQLAAELARIHTEDDLTALDEAIEDAATAIKSDDRRAFGEAVVRVHETIMERAGNQTLALFSRLLHELVERYYSSSASGADAAQMQRAVRSFRKLRKLVSEHDAEGAEDHWRKQMAYTSSNRPPGGVLDLFEA